MTRFSALGVLPEAQGMGLGSALCGTGLQHIEAGGYLFMVVSGHPGYYTRIRFEPASKYLIKSTYSNVPDEAFMIR